MPLPAIRPMPSSNCCRLRWPWWLQQPRPATAEQETAFMTAAPRDNTPLTQPPLLQVQGRSEEHTSELQSPCNLVCRLLLEKKKKTRMRLQIQQMPNPPNRDRSIL